MFTPDSLLEMAIAFKDQLTNELVMADCAASLDEKNLHLDRGWSLQRKSDDALACAEWMENHGITEAQMIGPFGNIKIEQHTKVRIKAGARVFGMGNDVPREGKVTTRAYQVTAVSIDKGYAATAGGGRHGKLEVRNQQVHWAGTGGYWRWTDASNVEVLS